MFMNEKTKIEALRKIMAARELVSQTLQEVEGLEPTELKMFDRLAVCEEQLMEIVQELEK